MSYVYGEKVRTDGLFLARYRDFSGFHLQDPTFPAQPYFQIFDMKFWVWVCEVGVVGVGVTSTPRPVSSKMTDVISRFIPLVSRI